MVESEIPGREQMDREFSGWRSLKPPNLWLRMVYVNKLVLGSITFNKLAKMSIESCCFVNIEIGQLVVGASPEDRILRSNNSWLQKNESKHLCLENVQIARISGLKVVRSKGFQLQRIKIESSLKREHQHIFPHDTGSLVIKTKKASDWNY